MAYNKSESSIKLSKNNRKRKEAAYFLKREKRSLPNKTKLLGLNLGGGEWLYWTTKMLKP